MTPLALALALLAQPDWRGGGGAQTYALAAEVRRAEERWALPAALLAAVVLVESAGRALVSGRRRCGGRDVGVGQVHAHGDHHQRLQRLLVLSVNIGEASRLLDRSRAICSTRGRRWPACRRGEWGLYNAGSVRWSAAVERAHHRLLREVIRGSRPDA